MAVKITKCVKAGTPNDYMPGQSALQVYLAMETEITTRRQCLST